MTNSAFVHVYTYDVICHVTPRRQRQYRLNLHFHEADLLPGNYNTSFCVVVLHFDVWVPYQI